MNLPKFTAEESIYQKNEHYYTVKTFNAIRGGREVSPLVMDGGGLSFECTGTECECKGHADCKDLGDTGICEGIPLVDWTCKYTLGGLFSCTCSRSRK